ncbi:hypothetical protein ACFFLS_11190 [Flavobacterium procerum]|uniref:Lipoprotein n=1 Tax=Flavobacterium procerum TaxID=1455569 RepID=A0ABV6BQ73_9FLAO
MIRKFLLLSLVASQLMISCSSDDNESTKPETELTLEEQIAELTKKSYSELTPDQQKLKLENEANEMLVQLDKTKKLGAIEAIENLSRLISISPVDIFSGKSNNKVEDILNVSGVYGIYTWNNTQKSWTKTASTTELKFVFPAKATQTTNNASFSSKSTSSDIKVPVEDSYNWQTGVEVNDYIFLPLSVDATLSIDGTSVASFTQTAKYSNGKIAPDEFGYKMSVAEGYAWEVSGTKAAASTSKGALTFNGKNLLSFNAGSTAQIDALITDDHLGQYRGKANALVEILDNFVIVGEMDLAADKTDREAINKLTYPKEPAYDNANSDFKAYHTAVNEFEKKRSESKAASFNKNIKLILVSKKDGTKIADLVQRSVQVGDPYVFELPAWDAQYGWTIWEDHNSGTFSRPYLQQPVYLKFNDKTEVEMGAYFSTGFNTFQSKFQDFIAGFQK